ARDDHRGGNAGRRLGALVELLSGGGSRYGHRGDCRRETPRKIAPAMSETVTQQQWICESCGFIYDPEEGDPDGGVPPGTPFEEIPDTWFCPVCGARKQDFEPYEE